MIITVRQSAPHTFMRFGRLPPSDKPEARFWMEDQNGVKHKVSPQTRFILEDENRSKEYFDYFCDLAPTLNERFIAAERKGEALWLTSFKTYVAALAFILSICALIGLLYTGIAKDAPLPLLTAVVVLVSSGGYVFFGNWGGSPIRISKRRPPLVRSRTPNTPL